MLSQKFDCKVYVARHEMKKAKTKLTTLHTSTTVKQIKLQVVSN